MPDSPQPQKRHLFAYRNLLPGLANHEKAINFALLFLEKGPVKAVLSFRTGRSKK